MCYSTRRVAGSWSAVVRCMGCIRVVLTSVVCMAGAGQHRGSIYLIVPGFQGLSRQVFGSVVLTLSRTISDCTAWMQTSMVYVGNRAYMSGDGNRFPMHTGECQYGFPNGRGKGMHSLIDAFVSPRAFLSLCFAWGQQCGLVYMQSFCGRASKQQKQQVLTARKKGRR